MQDLFNGLLAAAKADALEGSGILTLGELGDQLDRMESPEAMVVVEYGGGLVRFGELDSYRGYYSDLAIDPCSDWSEGLVTVEAALENLMGSIGTRYEGYKGGMYRMTVDTSVWVSGYGEASGIAVTGVRWTTDEERVGLYPPMVVITTKKFY